MMEGDMFLKRFLLIISSLVIVFAVGCSGGDDGQTSNEIPLATDIILSLFCEDEGVYPETCVLDNPDNPFLNVNITEDVYEEDADGNSVLVSEGNKSLLAWDCPTAKCKFYLWATALARVPTGENQFNTASSLHELYTESSGTNELVREQAIKAYRSVLDNFYDSNTYWTADWLPDEPAYAVLLRDQVGMRLYDPSGDGLLTLYDDPYYALEALGEWGYSYDAEIGTLN
jgi:hypothetical protein